MTNAKINCRYFINRNCLHPCAPRRWFWFKTPCLLTVHIPDARVKRECALQCPYNRPPAPPPVWRIEERSKVRYEPLE